MPEHFLDNPFWITDLFDNDPLASILEPDYVDLAKQDYSRYMDFQRDKQWFEDIDSEQARLKRLVSLGVNPHAAMESILGSPSDGGQGAATSPQSGRGSDVALEAMRGSVDGISNIVRLGIDGSVARANNNLAASQARWYEANIPKVGAEKDNIEQDTKNKAAVEENTKVDTKKKEQEIENMKQELKNLQKQYELDDEQLKMLQTNNESLAEMNQAQIEEIRARTNDYIASRSERYSNIKRNDKLNEVSDADISLKGAQTDLAEKQSSNVEEDTAGKKFINDWQSATGCPLGADEARYIEGLANEGDYGRITNYMNAKFQIKLQTSQTTTTMKFGNIYSETTQDFSGGNYNGGNFVPLPKANP